MATSVELRPMAHDAYAGERVFIIATGPSLQTEDLRPLQNEFTFGCARLIEWEGLPFTPTFYGCGEFSTYARVYERVEAIPMAGRFMMHDQWGRRVTERGLRKRGIEQEIPDPDPEKWHVTMPFRERSDRTSLRESLEVHIHDGVLKGFDGVLDTVTVAPGCSVLHAGLQPAIWLGFTEIYLLGLDMTDGGYVYSPDPQDASVYRVPNTPRYYQALAALQVVRIMCEEHGITLKNLSSSTAEKVLAKDTLANVLG